uniref:Uncharacterized protein n=1 Tax=Rhizophora mucronata TaxID=61149 RepID=A0A2P2NVY6_RHIMU
MFCCTKIFTFCFSKPCVFLSFVCNLCLFPSCEHLHCIENNGHIYD